MEKTLEINLAELTEFGNQIQGEVDPSVFDLKEAEGEAKTGMKYDLFIQRFENELLCQGSLEAVFELQCVRTLHSFVKTISVKDLAVSVEILEGEVNPTEQLREEIMILLPVYPTCDMGDEKMTCEIEEKYLALDKDHKDGLEDQPSDSSDDRWSALDQLGDL